VGVQPFLGCEVDVALVVNRFGGVRIAAQYAEIRQQFPHRAGFLGRERQIVRAPRVGGDGVLAAPRIAADLRFQFQDHEIGEPGPLQLPAGGQAGDAAADDDHRSFQRLGRFRKIQSP